MAVMQAMAAALMNWGRAPTIVTIFMAFVRQDLQDRHDYNQGNVISRKGAEAQRPFGLIPWLIIGYDFSLLEI